MMVKTTGWGRGIGFHYRNAHSGADYAVAERCRQVRVRRRGGAGHRDPAGDQARDC